MIPATAGAHRSRGHPNTPDGRLEEAARHPVQCSLGFSVAPPLTDTVFPDSLVLQPSQIVPSSKKVPIAANIAFAVHAATTGGSAPLWPSDTARASTNQ